MLYNGPARRAGIAPATRLIAINGRQFTSTLLRETVEATAKNTEPLDLLIKDGDFYRTHRINYHGGLRFPPPRWQHGSKLTYKVPPLARLPACSRASTSACFTSAYRWKP